MTHVATVRVIYGDTDQMGVVYYANYLRYFEIARAEWLRARGREYRTIEAEGLQMPVIEAHVRYRAPARYDDLLEIAAAPAEVRGASMKFRYALRRRGADAVLVEGWTQHACIGRDGRPTRFPDALRRLLDEDAAP